MWVRGSGPPLHPFGRGDPQEVEYLGEGTASEMNEHEPAFRHLALGGEDRALVIELGEGAREVVGVGAQDVLFEGLGHVVECGGKLIEGQGERPLRWL